jgi:hypothetical protein
MQRSQRIGLLVAAVIVAVVAVVLISNGDDDDSSKGDNTAQTTTTGGTTTTTGSSKPAEPAVTTIVVKDGKPVGGVEEIELDKGDTPQFRVKSDEDHEIHLHGYDIEKEVEAGGQVMFKLTADIDGLFEAEIEDLKEQIAEIRINP